MRNGSTTPMRLLPPSHREWLPEPYQAKAVEHLACRLSAGLALSPGLGKSSITLAAFTRLRAAGEVKTMLVIAPLRVCRQVWRQEGLKWSQFRELRFALLHGPKKAAVLNDGLAGNADIFLMNPEGAQWLAHEYFGRQLPFDVICIDELTKFKNSQSERSKRLRPRMERVRRKWGLTGSLAPNGYMDVFGQQLMLDGGAALGRFITHYRDSYFQVGYDGFTYDLLPGADKRIVDRLAPYWLQMSAEDYMTLPPLITDPRVLELDKTSRATYDKLKRDMIAALPDGVVTAANAAACYSKLAQMANGAVYLGDAVAKVHDLKLDALEELIDELAGAPLLVAYEFNHDLARIKERFGDLPHLGKGTTPKQETEWLAAWNAGRLPVLLAHPASAGHGLNMQEGNAAHVAWFSTTWDLELYDQFLRRVRRRGNESQRIFNHILIVRDTIDELKLTALTDKDTTQATLLRMLNAAVAGEGTKEKAMVRLSRQNEQTVEERKTPAGWGTPPSNDAVQRAAIQARVSGAREAENAPSPLFGESVVAARAAVSAGDYGGAEKAREPAARAAVADAPEDVSSVADIAIAVAGHEGASSFDVFGVPHMRLECLRLAATMPGDIIGNARKLWLFVSAK
jgi:hypothetical protein